MVPLMGAGHDGVEWFGLAAVGKVKMRCGLFRMSVLLICLLGCSTRPYGAARSVLLTDARQSNVGWHGAVATVHPLATKAGIEALNRHGNAVDAAVAAALTLGVVDPSTSGIGGGCFILIRRSDGSLLAIDGRETAPTKATRDMYVRVGKVDRRLSKIGALAIGVPGSLAAYDYALQQYGNLKLEQLLLEAADLAEKGFPINAYFVTKLEGAADDLAGFQASRAIFLAANGKAWPEGHILKQPNLAHTYRQIARGGIGWFYGGPFASAAESWMQSNGGILTAEDFANYRLEFRQPVVSTYHEYTIIGFGPPSAGGPHVAQILNILEHFDLRKLHNQNPYKRLHVIAEAMKIVFADRAYWLGDPSFTKVPRGLIDKGYAKRLADRINLEKVTVVSRHSTPPRVDNDVFDQKHTTHIAAADAHGNWVAITTTIKLPFGSKVVIPGTGVLMNNQMDDFVAQPGVPNAFGLARIFHE